MDKRVIYDRETRDFAMYLDNEFIGYAPTRDDAESRLDALAYERLRRQPTPEPTPTPVPTPAPVATPTRYASPSIIADAASVAFAVASLMPPVEREKHYRAITKAFQQLVDGAMPTRTAHGIVFPSRTKRGAEYEVVDGVCSCPASGHCWHLSGAYLVELIDDVASAKSAFDYDYAA